MEKQKNIKVIVALFFIFILSFSMFGCEKQRIKNELIEFDKQYYAITEWKEMKALNDKIKGMGQVFYSDTSAIEEIDNTAQKLLKATEIAVEKLRALKIPAPLDEFYQKKLQQLSYNMQILSESIQDYKNFKQGKWSPSDNEKMIKDTKELDDKAEKLYWECDTIRREVYREYGLDDLLTKYQE
jgi:hypothetical protein